MFIPRTLSALTLLCILLASTLAAAAQKEDVGPYEIHYSVVPTGFLTPEVAKSYNLTRSRAIGLLNISVLEKLDDGSTRPVSAMVDGRITNDIRQEKTLSFRQVEEGEAIYYLAQFQFGEGERLEYRANIRPRGHDRSYPIRFTQGLFND